MTRMTDALPSAENDATLPGLRDVPLSDEDNQVVQRWWAGEATEEELQDVMGRHFYARLPDLGCPTKGCKGDPRYAAPGRRHLGDCTYPRSVIPPEVGNPA